MLLSAARLKEALGEIEASNALYTHVLSIDAVKVEALACLGAHHFYCDAPERALKYDRQVLRV